MIEAMSVFVGSSSSSEKESSGQDLLRSFCRGQLETPEAHLFGREVGRE